MTTTSGDRTAVALRYWLLGAQFHTAAAAMDWASKIHTGTRRDGITPEFAHQVQIASYLRTLAPSLRHVEETLVTAFCHDVREDYGISDDEVRSRFGDRVADATDALSKEFRGVKRPAEEVFARIAEDPIASVVKGADRVNNQQSMIGVFTPAKVASYLDETEEHILPMLRIARRQFCDQEPAYENMKLVLVNQLRAARAYVTAAGNGEDTATGDEVRVPFEFVQAAYSVLVEEQAGSRPGWSSVKSFAFAQLRTAEKQLGATLRRRVRSWDEPLD